jgi:hypothetical protein
MPIDLATTPLDSHDVLLSYIFADDHEGAPWWEEDGNTRTPLSQRVAALTNERDAVAKQVIEQYAFATYHQKEYDMAFDLSTEYRTCYYLCGHARGVAEAARDAWQYAGKLPWQAYVGDAHTAGILKWYFRDLPAFGGLEIYIRGDMAATEDDARWTPYTGRAISIWEGFSAENLMPTDRAAARGAAFDADEIGDDLTDDEIAQLEQ